MTDVVDHAKTLEMQQRKAALDAQLNNHPEPAQDKDEDGNVYCLDCVNLISEERLAAKPDAARCIECQTLLEQRNRYGNR